VEVNISESKQKINQIQHIIYQRYSSKKNIRLLSLKIPATNSPISTVAHSTSIGLMIYLEEHH